MSKNIFLIPKSPDGSNPGSANGLRASIQEVRKFSFLPGLITIEMTNEGLVGFATGLIRRAKFGMQNSYSEEDIFPISKEHGALPEYEVYLHPKSNALLVLPPADLPGDSEHLPTPAEPEDYPDENNFLILGEAPGGEQFKKNRKNIIRASAQSLDGEAHAGRVTLEFSEEGMITFAGDLLRLAARADLPTGYETILHPPSAAMPPAQTLIRLADSSNPIRLKIVNFPSVDELLVQVGYLHK